jgi:hypothetical protein
MLIKEQRYFKEKIIWLNILSITDQSGSDLLRFYVPPKMSSRTPGWIPPL